MIRFVVLGTPVTQGSKRAFLNQHTGRIALTETGGIKHKSWREAVRSEAQRAAETSFPTGPATGRVAVHLQFGLQRPASAPKTRRTWPTGARSGDIDKLSRLVLDALTGVLFVDDSQVTELHVTKDYGTPGVTIQLYLADELSDTIDIGAADRIRDALVSYADPFAFEGMDLDAAALHVARFIHSERAS